MSYKKKLYLRECSAACLPSLRGSPLIYPELCRCASFKSRKCRLHLEWVQMGGIISEYETSTCIKCFKLIHTFSLSVCYSVSTPPKHRNLLGSKSTITKQWCYCIKYSIRPSKISYWRWWSLLHHLSIGSALLPPSGWMEEQHISSDIWKEICWPKSRRWSRALLLNIDKPRLLPNWKWYSEKLPRPVGLSL